MIYTLPCHPKPVCFQIYEVCPEKVQPLLMEWNGLPNTDVTWQPRTVDWNACVRTMMTSLY